VTWPTNPIRHGLSARGIRSFAYREGFIETRNIDDKWLDENFHLRYPRRHNESLFKLLTEPEEVESRAFTDSATGKLHGGIIVSRHPDVFEDFNKKYGEQIQSGELDIKPDFMLDADDPVSLFFMVTNGDMELVRRTPDLQDALVASILKRVRDGDYNRIYYYLDSLPTETKMYLLPKMINAIIDDRRIERIVKETLLRGMYVTSTVGHSQDDVEVLLKLYKQIMRRKLKAVDGWDLTGIFTLWDWMPYDAKDIDILYAYENRANMHSINYYVLPTSKSRPRGRELLDRLGTSWDVDRVHKAYKDNLYYDRSLPQNKKMLNRTTKFLLDERGKKGWS